jgi:biotin carboxyl carrier protein
MNIFRRVLQSSASENTGATTDDDLVVVRSPIVGHFTELQSRHRTFVKLGDVVEWVVLCIIDHEIDE